MNTDKIEVLDFYKNKYIVPIDSLDFSVHVYGIAIKDGKVLISPQLDGFDFPGGTAEKGEPYWRYHRFVHAGSLPRKTRDADRLDAHCSACNKSYPDGRAGAAMRGEKAFRPSPL